MTVTKEFNKMLIGAVAVGAVAASVVSIGSIYAYKALTAPNLAYEHKHYGNPNERGRVLIQLEGAKFNDSDFAGGAEGPQTFEMMVNDAIKSIKRYNLLEQAGIDPTNGIYKLRIEVTKE